MCLCRRMLTLSGSLPVPSCGSLTLMRVGLYLPHSTWFPAPSPSITWCSASSPVWSASAKSTAVTATRWRWACSTHRPRSVIHPPFIQWLPPIWVPNLEKVILISDYFILLLWESLEKTMLVPQTRSVILKKKCLMMICLFQVHKTHGDWAITFP